VTHRGVAIVVTAIATLPWSSRAAAFRTGADLAELEDTAVVRWSSDVIRFRLHDDGTAGVPVSALEPAVVEGFRAWNEPACSSASFEFRGLTGAARSPSDGQVTVEWTRSWRTLGLPADAAATTDISYVRNEAGEWQIVDADVLLNARDFRWGVDVAGDDLRDVRAVITHEAGHVVGILHTCETNGADGAPLCTGMDPTETMHPLYDVGLAQRTLSADAVAGLCFLYPSAPCDCASEACPPDACAPPPTCDRPECRPDAECAGDMDCAVHEVCNSAECEQALGVLGDPCASDADCATASCFEGACAYDCSDSICPSGYECHDAACAPMRDHFGEACDEAIECSSGLCVSNGDATGICTRYCDDRRRSCSAGYSCEEVRISEGLAGRTESVCIRGVITTAGCSVANRPAGASSVLVLLMLVTWIGRARARASQWRRK
jgi:hypothetical protein